MPYKDAARQRRYQRERVAAIRAAYLVDKACVDCGATTDLELDHLDRAAKVDHRIWSWSTKRRAEELAKCVVRCDPCHNERHAAEKRQEHGLGAHRRRGCRCEVCRAAKAAANRRWLARRGRESNTPERICSPPPYHSATAPEQATLFDLEQVA